MGTYAVVIGIVEFNNKILLLKRNPNRNNPNKWQTVSGFMRERESAEESVLR